MTGSLIGSLSWVVGFEEHLEPSQPVVQVGAGVDFEPHVIEPGATRIEGFALIRVMLLKLDDGARRRVNEQDRAPPIAADPVEFGEAEKIRPPSGARLCVSYGKRNVRHLAEGWHGHSSSVHIWARSRCSVASISYASFIIRWMMS